MIKQLEIRWVNLDPAFGAETQKHRPCVILQADLFNHKSRTFLVAPLLPGHKDWPFSINISPSTFNRLDSDRNINLKQIRAIDQARLGDLYGRIEKHYLPSIHEKLMLLFDLGDQ